jgi:Protein of unknown function (DUF2530)
MAMARRRRRGQGPPAVRPRDVDGVRTVAVGTVLWAITFVVLALFRDNLDAQGVGWWLWTCLAGVGLGLLGLEYTRKRRDAIARAHLYEEANREDEPVPAEPEPVSGEPGHVQTQPRPEAERVAPRPEHEPVLLQPEAARLKSQPEPVRAEPGPVRAEPEPVPPEPEPVLAEPPRPSPEGPPDAPVAEWDEADLLDIRPPISGLEFTSRRERRAARNEEVSDLDEPLLDISDDWRRVDDRPTEGRGVRQDDSTDDNEIDEGGAGYRGRRARRP